MNNKRVKKKIKLIVSIAIVLIGILLFKTPVFKIDSVSYNLSVDISENDIFKYGGIVKGETNLLLLDTDDVAKKLKDHPYVKSATVEKKYPNKLEIMIVYKEPYAIVKYSDLYITIDKNLYVLSVDNAKAEGFLIDGFVLESFVIGKEIVVESKLILRESLKLIELLEKSHIQFRPIIVLVDNGIEIQLNDYFRVRFGRADEIERKFNDFIDIYENLQSKDIKSGIIDVSNDGLPLFRPFGD
ncbi:MAG: FtsQ-type POTRA domain-containing protein [Acidaminobacteraceae bacterium]